jgi:hypothetical protein
MARTVSHGSPARQTGWVSGWRFAVGSWAVDSFAVVLVLVLDSGLWRGSDRTYGTNGTYMSRVQGCPTPNGKP